MELFSFSGVYWIFLGTIYLVWLTVQDYRNKMKVDDRKNFFMLGASLALFALLSRPFWWLFALLVVTFFLNIVMARINGFGRGDVNTFSWIFWGFGIVGFDVLIFFSVVFVVLTLLYHFFKNVVFRYEKPTPFFMVFLLSWCLTIGVYFF